MKQKRNNEEHSGITRREFVQYTAAAGAILSVPGLLSGCSHSDSDSTSGIKTETRNYYFDLANADPSHDYLLKVGAHFMPFTKMDAAARMVARKRNSFLTLVPDENLTHHLKASLPSDAITLCWIVGKDPSAKDGAWHMPMMFYHAPLSALSAARTRPNANSAPGADKLRHYGVTADPASVCGDDTHLLEDEFKNASSTAVAIIASHPEMLCAEPTKQHYISSTIIAPNPLTTALTIAIMTQGTASETGGWATQEVYLKDDGTPYLNSQGQKQYFPRWSQQTLETAGPAIASSLEQAKDDPILGTNVTDLDPSEDNSLQTLGTIWHVRDGITTVDASPVTAPGTDDNENIVFKNHSTKNGYIATYFFYSGDDRTITIEVENKFLRYLGLYIRFLDGSKKPIPVSELDDDVLSYFPSWARQSDQDYSTDYDLMGMMIGPELVILGIPIKSNKQQFTFKMPAAAAYAEVLAGGLGHGGASKYPEMVHYTGQVPTIILNLVVPIIFLALSAGTGYAQFMKNSSGALLLRTILGFIFDTAMAIYLSTSYRAPRTWIPVAKDLFLMLKSSPSLIANIEAYSDEGKVLDQTPGIGTALQVLAAIGTAVGIGETIEEVARSPSIYKYTLSYTHDINVTIDHDPNDHTGFPATATHYELKAYFDGGSPHTSGRIEMPGTSWSDPLSYTFSQVPKGGKVQIVVGFYSDTLWLAGKGKTDLVPNDDTAAQLYITIKEVLVPLTSDTQYSHKEKTALDDNGNLVWEAGGAPTKTKTDLSCLNQNGDLCELACITVSETFAAAGYSWKSFSTDVVSCDNGAHGQLFQFANISIDQNPESGHKTSGCGFSELVRIVYDLKDSPDENFYLDTTKGVRLVRQIRLTQDQPPDFDGPDSNKAWGKFSNPSHALVLHPQQKLISINSTVNKIEVLDLAQGVTTDDLAPLAEVHSATGTRSGLISGPICAAVAPDGTILVLESNNQRIQAFDIGGNPVKHFGANKDEYFVPLKEESTAATYLDMAVEYVGYIYVLSYTTEQGLYQYRLDIYSPQGEFLSRTTEVNASKLDVDLWRNVYTLNYEQLLHTDQSLPTVTEPSVSQWIPSTPT